jgi:hypothetical protein
VPFDEECPQRSEGVFGTDLHVLDVPLALYLVERMFTFSGRCFPALSRCWCRDFCVVIVGTGA